jgi:hypothetical protein
MKRSSRTLRSLLLLAALLISARLSADIIVLNSGEKIDCTILSETDTTLTYKYMLTPKIPDTKTIPKSDIKEITRFTPAQVEYKEKGLGDILPTGDLLSASAYESIIQDDLRTFVAKHPGTPEAAEANKIIEALSEEKNKVLAGQVKMGGVWLDEATAKREKYNVDAYRLRLSMKEKMGDLRGDAIMPKEINALRDFEILRTTYPASPQYLEAIPEGLEILDSYERRLSAMVLDQPVLKEARDKARTESEAAREAIDLEERTFKAALDAQKRAKLKWLDINRHDLKSIKDAQTLVAKEKQELKSLNLPALQNEIENLNAAIRYIADGNASEAEAVMSRLRPTKTSLINKRVFEEYDRKLKELQAKINAEMKQAKAVAAAATPAAGAEANGESTNPYAEAMKKKEAAKAKDDARKAKAKLDAAAADTSATRGDSSEEEQNLWQKINSYIPYIGAGLLVVLVIAMVMGKKKKEEED